ncbi:DNA-binding transcriptional regulator [Candidatus Saccharibacteria bacterium]|jgi:TrpR-related protein YerC/YecD|nr:DNA-binding transcriptional regulator [Candidatus Saccharibacteria bacterium]
MSLSDPTIWDDDMAKQLASAFLSVNNKAQIEAFLSDILTEAEIKEFANRLRAARMLRNGDSYESVQLETGMSTTTIARISKWLKQGGGGYELVLRQLEPKNILHQSHI